MEICSDWRHLCERLFAHIQKITKMFLYENVFTTVSYQVKWKEGKELRKQRCRQEVSDKLKGRKRGVISEERLWAFCLQVFSCSPSGRVWRWSFFVPLSFPSPSLVIWRAHFSFLMEHTHSLTHTYTHTLTLTQTHTHTHTGWAVLDRLHGALWGAKWSSKESFGCSLCKVKTVSCAVGSGSVDACSLLNRDREVGWNDRRGFHPTVKFTEASLSVTFSREGIQVLDVRFECGEDDMLTAQMNHLSHVFFCLPPLLILP